MIELNRDVYNTDIVKKVDRLVDIIEKISLANWNLLCDEKKGNS